MNDVTKDLLEALLIVARMAEDLKKPCGMDPESPQAIRNAQYMNISYAARSAIARAEAALSSSDDAPSRHPTDKDFRGLQMNDVTKDLLEALRDLIDSHWLEDSHAVKFDGTVRFSPSYDFSNLHCHRRSELRLDGFECVVWPGGYPDYLWSAYSTYDGSMWFEKFASEDTARAVCMEFLAAVMPEHPVSKARAAIAKATGEPQ